MSELPVHSQTYNSALSVQIRIIGSVIVRDMRTRFGRTHLGYLIAVMWPLSHLLFMLAGFTLAQRVAPIGTNATIFIATGMLPYILCLYPARMMTYAIEHNRPLLYFPIVKTTDLIIARAILETLTAFAVASLFCFFLFLIDIDIRPNDYGEALTAILGAVYLGIGMGFLNVILFALFRMASVLFFLILMLILYATSGVFTVPSQFSEETRQILWFNPVLHCVEWLRSAYYEGYGQNMVSKSYVVAVGSVCLFLGISGDKLLRGRFF